MPPDALWVQASGVDYSAAEDRRLISAIYTPGVINGLTLTAGSGLSVVVSAGRAIVADGAGGAYLCYFDTPTTVSGLSANTAPQVWVTVNPTSGQATVGAGGSLPTNPYTLIGSAVTGAAAVSTVNNARVLADSPAQATNTKYLPITGGTLTGTGALSVQRLQTPGADMSLDINFPFGARLGGSNRTGKHMARIYRDSMQSIPHATWSGVRFGTQSLSASSYGTKTWEFPPSGNTTSGSFFFASVPGDYHLTGNAFFLANATGTRRSRIRAFTASGTHTWTKYCTHTIASESRMVTWDGVLHADNAGSFFVFDVYQDSGGALNLEHNASPALGIAAWGSMRLIQAD